MKKLLFVLSISVFVLVLFPAQARAQRASDYQTSAGLRLSPFYGVTIKHFHRGNHALEGILHSGWGAFKITGLYEVHLPAFNEPGLRWYYGGGVHAGFGGQYYVDRWNFDHRRRTTYGLLGIDGVLGMEYTIQDMDVPLNFSVDWKPTIEFSPGLWPRGSELAISVRYIFR
jgi:hypothetical protein